MDRNKGGIRNLWGNVSDEELESTHGNIQEIAGVVQQHYLESPKEISGKLKRLMDSFDNETDKSLKLNDGIASYQRNPTSERGGNSIMSNPHLAATAPNYRLNQEKLNPMEQIYMDWTI